MSSPFHAIARALVSPKKFAAGLRLLAGCTTERGRAELRHALRGFRPVPSIAPDEYREWRTAHLVERQRELARAQHADLFSFLTCVYDTPVPYLERLARSVFAQTHSEFEWVVLDNGSRNPATLAAIAALGDDPRVRLLHTEHNLGIVGGMRRCLEAARHRYVLPLDSDDLLTEDALALFADHLVAHGMPALVYSDEDKVADDDLPFQPYFKPDWDPVLFWNTCYIAHMCALDRQLCLQLGAYTDVGANGCHDWDSFFRFWRNGHVPSHLPEVVYSWRIHAGSCAGDMSSKSYVHDSHRHVLGSNLRANDAAGHFDVEASPLFRGTPDWWIRRRRVDPLPLAILRVHGDDARRSPAPAVLANVAGLTEIVDASSAPDAFAAAVTRAIDSLPAGRGAVAICFAGVRPNDDEWSWDAIGMFERFQDTAIVGGRILGPDGQLFSAGHYFGFSGIAGCPDRGRGRHEPGYFAHLLKTRSVSAVSPLLCVVRPQILASFAARRVPWTTTLLGAWLGAEARAAGGRVIYSPFVEATIEDPRLLVEPSDVSEGRRFAAAWPQFVIDDALYSPHLSVACHAPYTPIQRGKRAADIRQARRHWGIDSA